jgi:hypothetical protein
MGASWQRADCRYAYQLFDQVGLQERVVIEGVEALR